jgi:hypothetical protein
LTTWGTCWMICLTTKINDSRKFGLKVEKFSHSYF